MHETMRREKKLESKPIDRNLIDVLAQVDDLPLLAIESDGSPFPQVIEAKFEAFCLRAQRLHKEMLRAGMNHLKSS
jgi:hypothetical protein